MTWLILPISAIIIIICIVVKDYTDGQAQRAEIEYRKRHEGKFIPEEQVDEYDIECETSDKPILKRDSNDTKYCSTNADAYPWRRRR